MRVAHVLHSFGVGGMEKGIATVVRHASPGVEHVVLCLAAAGESCRLLPEGTEVVALGKPPGNSLRFVLRLRKALRALRPDVVHTRNWGGVDGIVAARLGGLRTVCHGEHGWDMDDPEGASGRRIRVRRLLSRWVREITCVSAHMREWLERTVRVRAPVTQIYNGVDTQAFAPLGDGAATRARLGVDPHAFVVGTVGRLDPIKDHPSLLAAFARVRADEPGAVLLVVGDGPERERLAAAAGPGVRLLGSRTDVPALLRALDVFVLCSHNEGISNTLLEAMATGLPIVATRVGGNPELVRDGESGTLVPPAAPDALAAAMLRYRRDAALASAHGADARRDVVDRFGVAAMVRAYEAVWRRARGEG
jgi:sugar transferase (PEP-CTERM/EpsH1 system associated)